MLFLADGDVCLAEADVGDIKLMEHSTLHLSFDGCVQSQYVRHSPLTTEWQLKQVIILHNVMIVLWDHSENSF